MKLSDTQQTVIDLMKDGWELGSSSAMGSHNWLQKDGLGKGGETRRVSVATLNALYDKKLISSHYGFPTVRYYLI